ncbi:hypothetical protein M885DRAFT_452295, partial [Pelagophyceae sp. CCMP2097]
DQLDRLFGVWRSQLTGRLHRFDLVVSVWLEYPFALVSWTGSALSNRLVRSRANERGLSLSAHGLLAVKGDRPGSLVPYETRPGDVVRSEKYLFQLLGLAWRPPWLRDA